MRMYIKRDDREAVAGKQELRVGAIARRPTELQGSLRRKVQRDAHGGRHDTTRSEYHCAPTVSAHFADAGLNTIAERSPGLNIGGFHLARDPHASDALKHFFKGACGDAMFAGGPELRLEQANIFVFFDQVG